MKHKLNLNFKLILILLFVFTNKFSNSQCISETFDSYPGTPPSGWVFNGVSSYTTGYPNPNSLKFDTDGDNIESPNVTNPIKLRFWIKGNSTDAISALIVKGWNGSIWNTIDNIANLPTSYTAYQYTSGLSSFTKFQFTYSKSAGNLAFDSITVVCCAAPTTQATQLQFSNITASSTTVNWTNGNGTSRIVKMNTSNSFTNLTDGTTYTANTVYAGGEQVIYNGTGNSVSVTGLSASTTYWYKVYEYNCTGTNSVFLNSTATNNPNSQTTITPCNSATTQASNITFPSVLSTSINVSWTNGDGNYRLVIAKQGSAVTSTPTNGTAYNASSNFGSGTEITTGEFVVYNGSGNSVTLTGLAVATTYYFTVFEFCTGTGSETYLITNPPANNTTTINNIPTKCLEIESILVDGCDGGNEGKNEMVRFRVGPNPIDVADLRVDGAGSSGAINIGKWPNLNNLWLGICTNAQASSKLDTLNSYILSCGELIEPPSGILPSGAIVIMFTSTDYTPIPEYFANLGETVYVIFQCAGNTEGHFANYNGTSSTRTLVLNDVSIGCADTIIYDPSELLTSNIIPTQGAEDGGAVKYDWDGTATYFNNGCVAPVDSAGVYAINVADVNHLCISETLALYGEVTGSFSNPIWTTDGTGTFTSPNTLNTTYNPGLNETGLITLNLTVTSASCGTVSDTVQVNIHQLPTPTISNDTTICSGFSVSLTAGGGSTYTWSNGLPANATVSVSPTSLTTYYVTVTSNYGCKSDTSVTVDVYQLPTVELGTNQSLCINDTITLDAGAGFSYLWTGGTTNQTLNINADGTYYVTITDSNGCKATDNIVISDYVYADLNPSSTQTNCGASTGSVSVSPAGGSGSFTYLWSSNAGSLTTSSVSNLGVGVYDVTVDDGNCSISTSVSVSELGAPVLTLTVSDSILCKGETTSLTISGADSYIWNTGSTDSSITYTPLVDTIITVSGISNNCTSIKSINLLVNDLPIVYLGADIEECSGTSITLDAGTFVSYNWTGGSATQTINPVSSNTYYVTVTDINGCKNTDNVQVTINSNPTVNLGNDTTYCGSNSLTLNAGNGFTYIWDDGTTNQTFIATSTGVYYVTITDSNGCKANDNISVTINEEPSASTSMTEASCGISDGTATVTASNGTGNYLYTWDTNASSQTSPTASSLAGGMVYYVTVNDGNCTIVASINVIETGAPVLTLTATDTEMCFGDSLDFSITGATSYLWSTNSTDSIIKISPSTNTTLTVTGSSGNCDAVESVIITVHQLPDVELGTTINDCEGNTVILDAGTFDTYSWSTSVSTSSIFVSTGGTYSVTVTDSDNCTNSDDVTVTFNPNPTADLGNDKEFCQGSSAILDAGTGFTYLWSGGTSNQTLTVSTAGTYYVTISDSNGCSDNDSINVVVNQLPSASATSVSATCGNSNGSATALVTSGTTPYTYLWSNSGTTSSISGISGGTYTLTVSDSNNCIANVSVTIDGGDVPILIITPSDSTLCEGESSTLTVSGATSYLWNTTQTDSSIIVSPSTTSSYTVTETSSGCSASQIIEITVDKMPVITKSPDTAICGNDSITINATSNVSGLEWSTGDTTSSITVHQGIYSVSVSNTGCGLVTDTINITQALTPELNWQSDTIIYSESGTLNAGNPGSDYIWSTGETTQIITINADGTYSVTVTSTSDCEEKATINVVFEPNVAIHPYNTITPNDDGANDKWIIDNIQFYPRCEVTIFNRNGNKVFETTRYNNEKNFWDGKYNDKNLPAATYYYIIDLGDGSKIYKGHVSIVR